MAGRGVSHIGRVLGEFYVDHAPPSSRDPLRRRAIPDGGSFSGRVARLVGGVARLGGVPADVESFCLCDNPGVSLVNCDSHIAARLYWLGQTGYEPGLAALWRLACTGENRIVEVGANIGYYVAQGALAAEQATYIAVEPHPSTAAILRRNVELNALRNVQVVEAAAVASTEAEVWLHVPTQDRYGAPAGAFTSATGDAVGREHLRVTTVSFPEIAASADVIKIDAEGIECTLLTSIVDEIRARHPTLFIELLDGARELGMFLADLASDFEILVPSPWGLVRADIALVRSACIGGQYHSRDVVVTVDQRLIALASDTVPPRKQ